MLYVIDWKAISPEVLPDNSPFWERSPVPGGTVKSFMVSDEVRKRKANKANDNKRYKKEYQ